MTARVLYLDIETSPIVVHAWTLRDLNVGLNQIVEDPRMIAIGMKWGHERGVTFLSEHADGRQAMLEQTHTALDEADIVVGYNSKSFDITWIQGELAREGFMPPEPFRQIDLYREAKRVFRFPSHKLQYVSTALGMPGKRETGGHSLWVRCLAGDDAAWRKMETYCKRDVALLPTLHKKLIPWISNHPNMALYSADLPDVEDENLDEKQCPSCEAVGTLQRRGLRTTNVSVFQRFWCQPHRGGCGSWPSEGKRLAGASIR